MNAPTFRALLMDSFYQVLDNRVFRILAVLVLLPILVTFLVGFHEDHMSILFGWKQYEYGEMLSFLSQNRSVSLDDEAFQPFAQEMVITGSTKLLLDLLGGLLGMMLAIAATAFFVPRMLEKGAADAIFHKPPQRWIFFVARYFSGLLFVAILSGVLVGGMYLGILIVSDFSAPSVLWGAPALIYTYGLIHAFSMLAGVFTRSTVAAIMLSLVFFMGTGCVHGTWLFSEFGKSQGALVSAVKEAESDGGTAELSTELEVDHVEPTESGWNFKRTFFAALSALHYALPKTSDAEYIQSLIVRRHEIDGHAYLDKATGLALPALPDGFEVVSADALQLPTHPAIATELGDAGFALQKSGDPGACEITLRQRPRREISKTRRDGSERITRETRTRAASALEDVVESLPLQTNAKKSSSSVAPLRAFATGTVILELNWLDESTAATRSRRVIVMQAQDAIVSADINTTPAFLESEAGAAFSDWLEHGIYLEPRLAGTASSAQEPSEWYSNVFGTRSPWKYNVFFSIGSSLLFVLVALGLGAWKLSRIDF